MLIYSKLLIIRPGGKQEDNTQCAQYPGMDGRTGGHKLAVAIKGKNDGSGNDQATAYYRKYITPTGVFYFST